MDNPDPSWNDPNRRAPRRWILLVGVPAAVVIGWIVAGYIGA